MLTYFVFRNFCFLAINAPGNKNLLWQYRDGLSSFASLKLDFNVPNTPGNRTMLFPPKKKTDKPVTNIRRNLRENSAISKSRTLKDDLDLLQSKQTDQTANSVVGLTYGRVFVITALRTCSWQVGLLWLCG